MSKSEYILEFGMVFCVLRKSFLLPERTFNISIQLILVSSIRFALQIHNSN